MTEVIAEYEHEITAEDGTVWTARACARPAHNMWEGWIEFIPRTPGLTPVRTPTETTQPDRGAAVYWAEGLTPVYLEGALERALERPVIVVTETAPPVFDSPAPATTVAVQRTATAVLDPYAVYAQGEQRLADQLGALGLDHVRNIVRAYEILPDDAAASASRAELVAAILASARAGR
ncbi:MAG TPA: hypothetical protein VFM93_13080 [Candidatus Limnocylindria bacterium]|nr:hypothetical protein [Candidatus Limnocylindria bacterium]